VREVDAMRDEARLVRWGVADAYLPARVEHAPLREEHETGP
jgi:hypothetical protein